MKKLFSLLILSCFFVSCTSGHAPADSHKKAALAQQGDSDGAAAVAITPEDAARNATLSLNAQGFNLSDATIEWLVNGAIAEGAASGYFQATNVARGDTVQAKVVLKDRELLSNLVTIGDTPPEVTAIKLLPEVFKPGDTLNVAATGADADGDAVSFLYAWTKNGAAAGDTSSLASPLKRGDKICITVTPYDGQEYGRPQIVEREIRNMPPVITRHDEFTFNGSLCTYQVKASDPDGDALTYALEAPPAGMTIDSSTGLLQWNVPPDFKGKQNIKISVSDGNGGTAAYSTDITIQ